MRFFRVIFVSLIAVGVCGAVYLGLTFGLAAYMRYKTEGLADVAEEPPPATRPADVQTPTAEAEATPASPVVEDVAALMRRTWTASRHGLTSPPPFAPMPSDVRSRIVPVASQSWRPPLPEDARPTHRLIENRSTPAAPTAAELSPIPAMLMLAPPAEIVLPVAPPAKATTPAVDQVPAAAIAIDRNAGRPRLIDDPTQDAAEAMLLQQPAPGRTDPASPESVSIPDPSPYALGAVRTVLAEEQTPPTPPDRPEVVLPVK